MRDDPIRDTGTARDVSERHDIGSVDSSGNIILSRDIEPTGNTPTQHNDENASREILKYVLLLLFILIFGGITTAWIDDMTHQMDTRASVVSNANASVSDSSGSSNSVGWSPNDLLNNNSRSSSGTRNTSSTSTHTAPTHDSLIFTAGATYEEPEVTGTFSADIKTNVDTELVDYNNGQDAKYIFKFYSASSKNDKLLADADMTYFVPVEGKTARLEQYQLSQTRHVDGEEDISETETDRGRELTLTVVYMPKSVFDKGEDINKSLKDTIIAGLFTRYYENWDGSFSVNKVLK